MGGIIFPLFLCLLSRGFCWTYAVESEVQTCRDALKADSVTAFVTDTHYIIMSDPVEAQSARSPPFQRTHTTKISQRLMSELMHNINATVFWPMISEHRHKNNYRSNDLPISSNVSRDTVAFLSDRYIPFMLGALTVLLIMLIIHK